MSLLGSSTSFVRDIAREPYPMGKSQYGIEVSAPGVGDVVAE